MTTQRDLDTAAEVSLKICNKCGGYELFDHRDKCDPKRGAFEDQLIAAVPDVRSGKLGYGDGHVVFDLAGDFSVVFRSYSRNDSFALEGVNLIDTLTIEESAHLVRALSDWMRDTLSRREGVR